VPGSFSRRRRPPGTAAEAAERPLAVAPALPALTERG
jgi:hypothetical protein